MTGVRHARAPFWSFITSDCRYEKHFLSTIWQAVADEKDVAYAFGNFYFIDRNGTKVREWQRPPFDFDIFTREFIVSGYGIMRADCAKKCLPVVDVGYGWDWKWYLELAQYGRFVRVPEYVASWRDWDGNTTMKMRTGKIKAWKPTREYLDRLHPYS